jgi:hypothetical protein
MVVPEKILNMEVNANKEFDRLNAQIALKTTKKAGTSRTKKGDASAPPAVRIPRSTKGGARVRQPARKTTGYQPPVKRERVKREREEDIEVIWSVEKEVRNFVYIKQGPPRKRARYE